MIKTKSVINGFEVINFTELNENELLMILTWRNNENIRKWMYNDEYISWEQHLNFVSKLSTNRNKLIYLVKKDSFYIGVVSIDKIDLKNKNAYLGIYKNPDSNFSGKVLIECIKTIAFQHLKLHTLKLEVISDNTIALEFYKKNGFIQEGILKEFVYKNSSWKDVVIMGIINENI